MRAKRTGGSEFAAIPFITEESMLLTSASSSHEVRPRSSFVLDPHNRHRELISNDIIGQLD
jgi:hypothetical protein